MTINDLINELPDKVIMYQLETDYHIHRMDERQIRNLFINFFRKLKEYRY